MNVELIDSVDALIQLEPEWSALHRRCPSATPFQSPQWLLPWLRHLFGGGEICSIAMREAGELIGLAPLFRWGVAERRISFVGAGVSDYGGLLASPGDETECASQVWNTLAKRTQTGEMLDLQEIPKGSPLLDGRDARECSVCPVLELSSYPQSMDFKHRTDLRRARNKLEKQAGAHFTMATEATLEDGMDVFLRLHQMRWGPIEPSLLAFHKEAAKRFLAAGMLRLCSLSIAGAPAAAIYAFTTGRTLFCYLSGFDPSLAKLSAGALLLGWLIDRAIEEGLNEIDFLRQTEAYKYLWGARDRVNFQIVQSVPMANGLLP